MNETEQNKLLKEMCRINYKLGYALGVLENIDFKEKLTSVQVEAVENLIIELATNE